MNSRITVERSGIGPLTFAGELIASETDGTMDIRFYRAGSRRHVLAVTDHRPSGDYHWAHIYTDLPARVIDSIVKGA